MLFIAFLSKKKKKTEIMIDYFKSRANDPLISRKRKASKLN